MRKLLHSLIILPMILPGAAWALGLGDIKLDSALNQFLRAEIELLSVEPGDVEEIDVAIAPYEAFAKAGVDRPAFLMFLEFEVVSKDDGSFVVEVSSTEPVREPFLDFIVEVNWRSGRLLREYTLLLDPPDSYEEQPAPRIAAPVAETHAPVAQPQPAQAPAEPMPAEPEPAMAVEEEAAAPAQMTMEAPQEEEAVATPAPKMAERRPLRSAPAMPEEGIVYGPIKKGDTLWSIAAKLRPSDDVSVQQMMLALLKSNPYAFIDNNVNLVKRGFVLRVDDPSVIYAISQAEAVREVQRQNSAWQDYRTRVAAKAPERVTPKAPEAESEMPAPAAAAAKEDEAKLSLVAPAEEAAGEAAPGGAGTEQRIEALRKQLKLAMESTEAQQRENSELQTRVTELQQQIEKMERLLTLKDEDLASLQEKLAEKGEPVELPSEQVAEAPLPAEGEEKPVEAGAEEAPTEMPEGVAGAEGETQEAAPGEEQPAAEKPEEPKAEAPEPVAEPEPAKPAEKPPVAKKPVAKPVPVPQPAPEPSLLDMVFANLYMLIGGVAGIVVLIAALVFFKRRKQGGGFQESILSGGSSSMMKAGSEEGSGETSFLSDLAVSGMGTSAIASEEGEVDALTEADVYIAYGRHHQAEELLKEAMEKDPENMDLVAKLLEIYSSMEDGEQFTALAEANAAKLQQDEQQWGKILSMGHKLSPENPLFAAASEAAAPAAEVAPAEAAAPPAADVFDIGLDLDELSAEMEGETSTEEESGEAEADQGLDFGEIEEAEEAPAEEKPEEGGDEFADLDFGSLEEEAPAEEEAAPELDMGLGGGAEPAAEEAAEEGGELDFDLSDFSFEEEAEAPAEEVSAEEPAAEEPVAEAAEEETFDFDFGSLEEETPAAAEEEGESLDISFETPEEETALADIDFGDLGLGEESEESGDLGDLGDLSDLEDDELLGDADEMGTKLDLAKAYIDMGETDGAREMLQEVVQSGSEEQKGEAQSLLDNIG